MIYKYEYKTQSEREKIILDNTNMIPLEEQFLCEGNFLIFSDTPRLEEQLKDLKNTVDLLLLKQEGVI